MISENLSQSMDVSLEKMQEAFVVYRGVLHRVISKLELDLSYESVRQLNEARSQYQEVIDSIKSEIAHFVNQNKSVIRLLNIQATIAGLARLIAQHAVRSASTAYLSLSLFRRVRQLTITHPAIAPPKFA
jgi:hypothetical protein